MLQEPFYDPLRSYEENYTQGPFQGFADGLDISESEPRFDFLGIKINYPLGIPAGPLLNSKFVEAAFRKGFDVPVYKTVRSTEFPCHPFPNVLSVHIGGDLTLEKAKEPLIAEAEYGEPLSITNSFGVPSRAPQIWQEDAKKAIAAAKEGQVMVMSFMGTVKDGQTAEEFVSDFSQAAQLSLATGAKIFEANLSCPNIGNEGLVCYNLDMTERITAALREILGDKPLILKVGYYQSDEDIETLAHIAKKYAQGIASINTIAAKIVTKDGKQALPGSAVRLRSGVCGAAIKWAGLEMTKKLAAVRKKIGGDFRIVGTGGVTTPSDFKEYRERGADIVMSATGAMWNPYLARDIKAAFPNG
jgi:dihydroorotate dehydrogenase (NAD+) catalytic subunit